MFRADKNSTSPLRAAAPLSAVGATMRDREGSTSMWGVFWTIALCMIGGVAVDVTNAYSYKSRLQATADASALAAVLKMDDLAEARTEAITLAQRNMPPSKHGEVVRAEDVVFGTVDETGAFTQYSEGGDEPNAVKILAGRDGTRANAVPTWMLRLAGIDDFEVEVASTAKVRPGGDGGGGGGDNGFGECYEVVIMSRDWLNLGGGNHYRNGVCLHGDNGVQPGGGDCFEVGTRISSATEEQVKFWNGFDNEQPWNNKCNIAAGEIPESQENLVVAREVTFPMLTAIENGLYERTVASVAENSSPDGSRFYGSDLIPDFVLNADGYANVVYLDKAWTPGQPNNGGTKKNPLPDLEPYTIYISEKRIQIGHSESPHNVAILTTDALMASGNNTGQAHDHAFYFSKGQLNFGGGSGTSYGSSDEYCAEGEYRVYILSETSAQLAGFGQDGDGMHGVMMAAPRANWGGSMDSAGGLYIEGDGYMTTGGDVEVSGCTTQMSNIYGVNPFASNTDGETVSAALNAGSDLVQ